MSQGYGRGGRTPLLAGLAGGGIEFLANLLRARQQKQLLNRQQAQQDQEMQLRRDEFAQRKRAFDYGQQQDAAAQARQARLDEADLAYKFPERRPAQPAFALPVGVPPELGGALKPGEMYPAQPATFGRPLPLIEQANREAEAARNDARDAAVKKAHDEFGGRLKLQIEAAKSGDKKAALWVRAALAAMQAGIHPLQIDSYIQGKIIDPAYGEQDGAAPGQPPGAGQPQGAVNPNPGPPAAPFSEIGADPIGKLRALLGAHSAATTPGIAPGPMPGPQLGQANPFPYGTAGQAGIRAKNASAGFTEARTDRLNTLLPGEKALLNARVDEVKARTKNLPAQRALRVWGLKLQQRGLSQRDRTIAMQEWRAQASTAIQQFAAETGRMAADDRLSGAQREDLRSLGAELNSTLGEIRALDVGAARASSMGDPTEPYTNRLAELQADVEHYREQIRSASKPTRSPSTGPVVPPYPGARGAGGGASINPNERRKISVGGVSQTVSFADLVASLKRHPAYAGRAEEKARALWNQGQPGR